MTNWLKDANGNRCSVEYFGSREAAQAALDSLKNCLNCTNCSDCSRCSDCLGCLGCSGCSRCSRCSRCSHVAWLYNKKNLRGDPDADPTAPNGQPPIPKIEDIHRKVYEAITAKGHSLDMSAWHTCGTTHCRGGWVVHLAGEAGYALESFHNTALAAQFIYRESGAPINPCRFYDSNQDALADIKRLAEEDA